MTTLPSSILRASLLLIASGATISAQAVLLDFENLPNGANYGNSMGYSPVQPQGFNFRAVSLKAWKKPEPTDNGVPNYTGSVALFADQPGDTITIYRLDGKAFDLQSMDVANLYTQSPGGAGTATITFTGILANGGTVTKTFTTVRSDALQNVVFSGFDRLSSVSWIQGGYPNYHQFDNVNVTAVPEPATIAALAIGSFAALRKRRRS